MLQKCLCIDHVCWLYNLKILAASIQILHVELGLAAPTCNLSTLETKAGGVMGN